MGSQESSYELIQKAVERGETPRKFSFRQSRHNPNEYELTIEWTINQASTWTVTAADICELRNLLNTIV